MMIPVLVYPSANLATTKRTGLYIDLVWSKFVIRLNNSEIKMGLGSMNLDNSVSFSIILEIIVDIVVNPGGTFGFLVFSGGVKWKHRPEMG